MSKLFNSNRRQLPSLGSKFVPFREGVFFEKRLGVQINGEKSTIVSYTTEFMTLMGSWSTLKEKKYPKGK